MSILNIPSKCLMIITIQCYSMRVVLNGTSSSYAYDDHICHIYYMHNMHCILTMVNKLFAGHYFLLELLFYESSVKTKKGMKASKPICKRIQNYIEH